MGRLWISGIRNEDEKTNFPIFIVAKDKLTVKEKNKVILGNGLDWNFKSKKFFFTDSKRFRIYCYRYSKDPVNLSKKGLFFLSKGTQC